jgi:hypothetical protein
MTIGRQYRPTRDTGGADTSLGNGICVAFPWLATFCRCQLPEELSPTRIQVIFGRLGLDLKVAAYDHPWQPTFLKGMWYFSHLHGFAWAPLPSRILKMGKSHSNPATLYKLPYTEACMQFGHDLALSYKGFGDVPFLKQLVEAMSRWPVSRASIPIPLESWKVQVASDFDPAIDMNMAMLQVCDRYSIESGIALNFCAILSRLKPFTFLEHIAFHRLAGRDYA